MKNTELITKVSEKSGLYKNNVILILEKLAEVVGDALLENDKVTIPGIAILSISDIAAKVGRNPQTGEALNIPAHKRVKYKTVKALKDKIR